MDYDDGCIMANSQPTVHPNQQSNSAATATTVQIEGFDDVWLH